MTRWLLIMSSDLTLVHCRGWALDGLASSSDELLSDDEYSSASVFQLAGSVVCFIARLQVRILLVGSKFLITVGVTLLLAAVFLKRVPLADNRTTLGTEEVSLLELG